MMGEFIFFLFKCQI